MLKGLPLLPSCAQKQLCVHSNAKLLIPGNSRLLSFSLLARSRLRKRALVLATCNTYGAQYIYSAQLIVRYLESPSRGPSRLCTATIETQGCASGICQELLLISSETTLMEVLRYI